MSKFHKRLKRQSSLFSLNPLKFIKNLKDFADHAKTQKFIDIVVLGDKGVGKSSFCHSFWGNSFSEKHKSFGSRRKEIKYLKIRFNVYLHCYNNMKDKMKLYLRNRGFFILLFALDNKETLRRIEQWHLLIDKHAPNSAVVLVGTKSDLKRQIKTSQGKRMAKRIKALRYYECSSKSKKKMKINIVFFYLVKFATCVQTQDKAIRQFKTVSKAKALNKMEADKITMVLQELKLDNYKKNFARAKIIIDDFEFLDDDEIRRLIPDHFPRERLKRYIKRNFSNLKKRHSRGRNRTDSISSISSSSSEAISTTTSVDFDDFENFSENLYIDKDLPIPTVNKSNIIYQDIINSGTFGIIKRGLLNLGLITYDVAIKDIPLTNDEERETVLNEVKIMTELEHENVIKCYGVWVDDRRAHIVLEYCEKGDLFFNKKKLKTDKDRITVMWQIAKGMEYIHSYDIVHRDLKPRNILISTDDVCKISDYGASKHVNSVSGSLVGTVEYIAPEQLSSNIDPKKAKKIDVYAYGIIFWEIMTGETPYDDIEISNEFEKIYRIHKNDSRPDINMIHNHAISELIESCWHKEADKRPDFVDIVLSLAKLLEDEYQVVFPIDEESGFRNTY